MAEPQERHYMWTCPVCRCGNGYGIASCDGFGDETHSPVYLSDLYRESATRIKELEQQLRDANAHVDELHGRLSGMLDDTERLALNQAEEARHMRTR